MPSPGPLLVSRLIETLGRHQVRYILIGALAARLQGFPRVTADLDIAPAGEPDNLGRLAAALRELGARVYVDNVPEGLPFDCSAAMLARGDIWNLVTDAGRVDIAFQPSGTAGFDDLQRGALTYQAFGQILKVACLADIIRSKEAAGRPKDRSDLLLLRELLRRADAEAGRDETAGSDTAGS